MKRWFRLILSLMLALITGSLLAACGGTSAATTPTAPAVSNGTSGSAAAVAMVPRPSAPAAEDEDFREDSVTQVAATGKPQLIEVFSYD